MGLESGWVSPIGPESCCFALDLEAVSICIIPEWIQVDLLSALIIWWVIIIEGGKCV